MAGLQFDFSNKKGLRPSKKTRDNVNYTYRDINTTAFVVDRNDNLSVGSSQYDLAAVRQSLRNIFSFRNGENILDPEFGIGQVYAMLYTTFDKYTTEKMLKTIRTIVSEYEPRVEIISIPTEYDEDKNEYHLTVNYYVPSLMETATMEVYLSN